MRPKNKRQSPQQPSISPSQTGRLWGVILLALVILFFSAIRFRLRDMPLERALELFERGMRLSDECRKQLEEAETRIETLIHRGEKVVPEPFTLEK